MVEDALAEAGVGSETGAQPWDSVAPSGSSAVNASGATGRGAREVPTFHSGRSHTAKDTEQLGILLGCEGLEEGHPDRFVDSALLTMLGGGIVLTPLPECA